MSQEQVDLYRKEEARLRGEDVEYTKDDIDLLHYEALAVVDMLSPEEIKTVLVEPNE
jgi:hypothetical protein